MQGLLKALDVMGQYVTQLEQERDQLRGLVEHLSQQNQPVEHEPFTVVDGGGDEA